MGQIAEILANQEREVQTIGPDATVFEAIAQLSALPLSTSSPVMVTLPDASRISTVTRSAGSLSRY